MNLDRLSHLLSLILVATLAACGSSSDDGDSFVLRTTSHAAEPTGEIVVRGQALVYLASEVFTGPTGTDLNGDGDKLDHAAVAVNLASTSERVIGVAARSGAIVGSQFFVVVDEGEDSHDWNGDLDTNDVVLLNWSEATGVTTFVDLVDLESGEKPLAVDARLFYTSGTSLGMTDETSLRYVTDTNPTLPVVVFNTAGAGTLEVHLLREDEGLLFCRADETDNGADLNADGDATDLFVLALLDGTLPDGRVKSTALAMADDESPVDAHELSTGGWLAAFLVDELAQGNTNLNAQALFSQPLLPESCAGTPDIDTNDQVLHYLDTVSFFTGTPPVDTGLVGSERVLAFEGFVAAISSEADSNCDLNEDSDSTDDVARWVATGPTVAPERDAALMHALATSIPGGSRGLSVLDNRLVAVVDEEDDDNDLDGVPLIDFDLVGWIEPGVVPPTWHFAHQSSSRADHGTGIFDSMGDSEPFAGTSWMASDSVLTNDGRRLGLTFLEEVPGTNPNVSSLNTNVDCGLVAKDSDKTDALPVWADFESGPVLDFDGVGYSVDSANPGIEITPNFVFFRVSEAADNRDYNADGVANDVVLFRNPLGSCGPVPMATSSTLPGPVIITDGTFFGAAFLSSETQAGVDFDGDGDTSDLVVRFFRF